MTCANLCVLLFTLLTGVVVFAANDGADIVDYAARFFCPCCRTTTFRDEPALNEHLRLEHGVQNGHVGMYLDYVQEAASSSTSQPDPGQQEHESPELPGPATTSSASSRRRRRRPRPPSRTVSDHFSIREHHGDRIAVPSHNPDGPGTSTPTWTQANDYLPRCYDCSLVLSNTRLERVRKLFCQQCLKEQRRTNARRRRMLAMLPPMGDGASGETFGGPE